jgi:hypothetical protein
MHPSIQKLTLLAYSFPVFDRLIRYKLSALEKPDVISHLHTLRQTRQATILAVDLASQQFVIGYMSDESPASRAMIDGRLVSIPR